MQNRRTVSRTAIITIILSILVIAVGGQLLYNWAIQEGSPDEIASVANQFKPNPSWESVSSWVRPPANVCFLAYGPDAGPCPYSERSWSTHSPLTHDLYNEVTDAMKAAGWNFDEHKDCKAFKESYSCNATLSSGYSVYMDISSGGTTTRTKYYPGSTVTLEISKQ